jgi:hypothetical protein
MLNLTKKIEPGSWRYLGLRCPSIPPGEVPIAGASIEAIKDCLKGDCYRIGRINPRNAFVVVKESARFLYVRPTYTNYRYVALKVFPKTQWDVDFDHALGMNICRRTTPPFQYILMLRVPPSVNRRHGQLEKLNQLQGVRPDVCFADDRILDKWLGRSPWSRTRSSAVMAGYSYANRTDLGLTLKQRGVWAYAIGIDDNDLSMSGLSMLSPSTA